MKTFSKIMIIPMIAGALLIGAVAARADRDDHHGRAHAIHHARRMDLRGERLQRRGEFLENHGHPIRGQQVERRGTRMDNRSDRWMRNHGVHDNH